MGIPNLRKSVFAKCPSLNHHISCLKGTEVDQPHHRPIRFEPFDEGGGILGQTGAFSIEVEVAEAGHQETPVVNQLWRTQRQLNQRLGCYRVGLLPAVGIVMGGCLLVSADKVQSSADLTVTGA